MTGADWLALYSVGAGGMFLHVLRRTRAGWLSLLCGIFWPLALLACLAEPDESEVDTW